MNDTGAQYTEIGAPVWCVSIGQSANYNLTSLTEDKRYSVGPIPSDTEPKGIESQEVPRPTTFDSIIFCRTVLSGECCSEDTSTNGLINPRYTLHRI